MSTENPAAAAENPEQVEDLMGTRKWRQLSGGPLYVQNFLVAAITILCAGWSINLHHIIGFAVFKEQFLALIFALAMAAIFIGLKANRENPNNDVPWYDWMFALACLICGLFVVASYRDIVETIGELRPERVILGYAAVLLVFEATRRATGWALVVMGAVFISYSALSHLAPGLLNVPSTSLNRIATYLYLDNNALLGTPLDVTTSIIVAFILFGRVLFAANGDKFLNDFALTTMGKYRGGPAKVAVVASSLFGTISGSAVSNVVMDGPITIPMMRKSGYRGHVAAAIEAVASTGGQIMPPVMGIVAFLMVDVMGVTYGEVIIAAALPALMYYLALFMQVDLEAAKRNLKPVDTSDAPSVGNILARGWIFIIPIFLLIWTLLVEAWEPGESAMLAVGVTIVVAFFNPATRPSLNKLWLAVRETGQTVLELVIITALAGMIIGSIQISTLGFNFSLLLTEMAGDSALSLLLMTALVCIILGMGMPSGVIYLMLALLIAPALEQVGIPKMAAHLFIFYFGMLSMITPPICIATFAACAVANTDFWKTGLAGVRLGIAAYVVPFVFVFQPGLIFEGSAGEIVIAAIKTSIGVALLAVGMAGYMFRNMSIVEQILIGLCGVIIMVIPLGMGLSWPMIGGAAIVTIGITALQLKARSQPTGETG
jgi:TRAP transporter 4TM/12TM fusion protein